MQLLKHIRALVASEATEPVLARFWRVFFETDASGGGRLVAEADTVHAEEFKGSRARSVLEAGIFPEPNLQTMSSVCFRTQGSTSRRTLEHCPLCRTLWLFEGWRF